LAKSTGDMARQAKRERVRCGLCGRLFDLDRSFNVRGQVAPGEDVSDRAGDTVEIDLCVVRAAPLLRQWLEVHPFKDEPDAPLWIGLRGMNKHRILTRDAIARVLERAARRAEIKKRIHPHLFRHSRATELASQLTEAQLKEVFGWATGSGQAATYVHLSGRNVDDAILRTYVAGGQRRPAALSIDSSSPSTPWQIVAKLLQDPLTLPFLNRRARQLGLSLIQSGPFQVDSGIPS
jgi:hypothetical protein